MCSANALWAFPPLNCPFVLIYCTFTKACLIPLPWVHHYCLCRGVLEKNPLQAPLHAFAQPGSARLLAVFKGTVQTKELLCLHSPCKYNWRSCTSRFAKTTQGSIVRKWVIGSLLKWVQLVCTAGWREAVPDSG